MASSIQHIYCLDSQYAMARVAFGRKERSGVIDLDGNFILEPKYTFIAGWGGRYMYVSKEKQKHRIWDAERRAFLDDILGRTITDVNYVKGASTLTFREGRRYGICDEAGSTIIPAQFDYIHVFGRGYVADGKKGFLLLGPTGEVLIPEIYDELVNFARYYYSDRVQGIDWNYDIVPARLGNEWFYVDRTGKRISERTYASIEPFTTGGYAIFKNRKGRCGIIDKDENILVPARYDRFDWEGESILSCQVRGRVFLVNPLGEKLLKQNIGYAGLNRNSVCGKFNHHLALWWWIPATGLFQRSDFKELTPRSFQLTPTKDYVIVTQYAHTIEHADYTLASQDGKLLFERFYDGIDTSANPDRIFVKEGKKWFLLNAKEEILKEIEYPDLERL